MTTQIEVRNAKLQQLIETTGADQSSRLRYLLAPGSADKSGMIEYVKAYIRLHPGVTELTAFRSYLDHVLEPKSLREILKWVKGENKDLRTRLALKRFALRAFLKVFFEKRHDMYDYEYQEQVYSKWVEQERKSASPEFQTWENTPPKKKNCLPFGTLTTPWLEVFRAVYYSPESRRAQNTVKAVLLCYRKRARRSKEYELKIILLEELLTAWMPSREQ